MGECPEKYELQRQGSRWKRVLHVGHQSKGEGPEAGESLCLRTIGGWGAISRVLEVAEPPPAQGL